MIIPSFNVHIDGGGINVNTEFRLEDALIDIVNGHVIRPKRSGDLCDPDSDRYGKVDGRMIGINSQDRCLSFSCDDRHPKN